MKRHKGLEWDKVAGEAGSEADKLWSLHEMETTGGEPDVVGLIKRPANTYSMIVRRKVQKAAEAFAMTGSPGFAQRT